jgi:hypothetical protein
MSDIKSALLQYNTAMDALEAAEKAVQEALLAIKTVANASTVDVEGQFFQVRERKDKLYLCELNGKPRGRPKGSKNTKPRKGSKAVEVIEADELNQPAELVFIETPDAETDVPEHTGVRIIVEPLTDPMDIVDVVDSVAS